MILVEYNAYMSSLCKKEKNYGKEEKQLIKENHLMDRVYYINKCNSDKRHKYHLPISSYDIKPILVLKTAGLSDLAYTGVTIGVEVTEEEYKSMQIPYDRVYFLSKIRTDYYKRNIDNLFLMEQLSDIELCELEEEEVIYYMNHAKGIRYAKEHNFDGTISLTVINDEASKVKKYYVCDETYPENMESLISYLEINSTENYVEKELPSKKKKRNGKNSKKYNLV